MILSDTVEVVAVIGVTSAAVLAGVVVGIRACTRDKMVCNYTKPEPASPVPKQSPPSPCPIGCDLEVTGVALSDDGELTEVLCKTCNKCYEFRHKQPSTEKPV